MWYLNRGHRLDMNVQEAWLQGATGEGISVTILDDGIEKSHPDIVANYDPLASYDVNQNDNDPTPRYDLIDSNRHGKKTLPNSAQCSKIRKKVQFQKCKKVLFAFSKMAKNPFLHLV